MAIQIYEEEGKAPMLIFTYEGNGAKNVMLDGHLDKQPHLTGDWSEGLGPVTPVIKDDCLYGRGGADDGYAAFATLFALKNCLEQGVAVP